MIKNTVDTSMLSSLEVIVSEKKVKTTAKKKEPIPTNKIYLPVTVDLLLPKKNHLMLWLANHNQGYNIVNILMMISDSRPGKYCGLGLVGFPRPTTGCRHTGGFPLKQSPVINDRY
jgi:hypothetical protein